MSTRTEATSVASRGTETLLVAEDEESVRRVVVMILRRHGYTVLAASSGQEALTLWKSAQGHIDLLVTDVVMPVMRGMDLARRVRTIDPTARILLMSGYPEDILGAYEASAGPFSFVQKPIRPAQLVAKVREALLTAR